MAIGKQYIIPAATLVVGLVLGTAVGTSEAPEPAPAPTVTVTATPEPAPTVTVTAEPEIVEQGLPQDCIDALEAADKLALISADFAALVSQHLTDEQVAWMAVADNDWTAITTYTSQMEDFNSEIKALTARAQEADYVALKAACLGSGARK